MTIPTHRLDAIEGAVSAMHMSVAEQRELVKCYRESARLREALQAITDHFAAVMGGPVMQAAGVVFENGVEGIPTIKQAREVLSQ